jgi:hypothetical protein
MVFSHPSCVGEFEKALALAEKVTDADPGNYCEARWKLFTVG